MGANGPAPAGELAHLMETRPAVRDEQARLLYRSAFALLANLVTSAALGFMLWNQAPRPAIFLWLTAMVMVVAARFLLRRQYHRAAPAPEEAGAWIRRFTIGAFATGCIWSVVMMVPLTVAPLPSTVFAAFIVGGMGIGAVAANAAFLPAFYAFTLPATVPFTLSIAARGSPEEIAMSLMGMVLIGAMASAAHASNKTLLSIFRLEADNAELIDSLTKARDELAGARDNLELEVKVRTVELRDANQSLARENAERRSAEEALRESEAWVRTIAESVSDWFWERDAEHRFTFVSERHAEATGLPSARCVGKTPRELYGLRGEIWRQRLADLEAHRDYRDAVFTFTRNDGARRVFRESGKAVIDANGSFRGYRGAGADITAEIEAREAADAARAQLVQAQKMEAIGQLTGGVAHDFNNLLGVVIGSIEALEDDLAGDKREPARQAINAALRGAELVKRLLAFSRRQDLTPERISINDQVVEVIGMLGRTLGSDVEIATDLGASLPAVSVDRSQFQTALINLAVNARDAMPRGGELSFTTALRSVDTADAQRIHGGTAPGAYVAVTVRDTGHGMTTDVAESAIDPFFTTKPAGEGSGLGLSMVYGFAKQSGGHLVIASEPGRGTAITLCFPAGPVRSEKAGREMVEAKAAAAAGEKILVVEDNADLLDLVTKLLKSIGYHVTVATDAEAALRKLDETPDIDLLFTDVLLSRGMNGFDLGREAVQRKAGLKVLYTSGYTDSALPGDPASGERVRLVHKPFTKARLASAVRTALDGADA